MPPLFLNYNHSRLSRPEPTSVSETLLTSYCASVRLRAWQQPGKRRAMRIRVFSSPRLNAISLPLLVASLFGSSDTQTLSIFLISDRSTMMTTDPTTSASPTNISGASAFTAKLQSQVSALQARFSPTDAEVLDMFQELQKTIGELSDAVKLTQTCGLCLEPTVDSEKQWTTITDGIKPTETKEREVSIWQTKKGRDSLYNLAFAGRNPCGSNTARAIVSPRPGYRPH